MFCCASFGRLSNRIFDGRPGVGKSHLLASLGHVLIQQGTSVLWQSTAQLVQRLLAAKRDLRLVQELAKLDRFACLILDDIGYVQHSQDEMEVLFTLLSERTSAKVCSFPRTWCFRNGRGSLRVR